MKKRRFLPSQNVLTLIAMIAGVLTAYLHNIFLDNSADIIADITVRLMKLVAIPLLFLSIVSSASHFRNLNEIKSLGLRIVKYTILTTFFAALVAELLYLFVSPILLGVGAESPEKTNLESPPGFFQAFMAMIPDNLAQAFLDNNVLAIVVIAIILALAILTIKPQQQEILFGFFGGLLEALMKIVHIGLKFIPFSVWAFVTILARQVLSEDTDSINAIGGLTLTVIGANLIQGLIVLPLLLKFKKISPIKLFKQVKEALILAFFTRSSLATLPVTLEHAVRDAKISEDTARLSLPLCTTINMNGCAQFILLSVYFVSAYTGSTLVWWDHLGMILLAVIAAIGNAGVPMGCFFLASSILASKNIPIHLMGSILPLYAFIDMVETSLNVWSDVAITKIVDNETKKSFSS
jgi:Na+/H+-dicarboxylate symporter